MKLFDAMTWLAIVILIPGALAIFVWFLRDARRVLRSDDSSPRDAAGRPPAG
jgi:hypothetical protein